MTMDTQIKEWRERVLAAGSNAPLRLRGSGSKDFYGQALAGEVLDTRAYQGVVSYEPTELVVTARCGTPLAELEAVLAERGQVLAFEPPHFGPAATVGGMVAAGLSGPRRAQAGAVRDFVLGVQLMDGQGQVLNFGGQVMKNVAGYDVPRLMAGSLGSLGLLLEISLKVLPKPVAEATLRLETSQAKALTLMNQWGGQPLPITATAWENGSDGEALMVRLAGARAAVAAAKASLGGAVLEEGVAAAYWASLREQTHAHFAGAGEAQASLLWRLSVPSTAPVLDLPGQQLVEWGGAQRWLRSDADARTLRAAAEKVGGHATLFRATVEGRAAAPVFHPLSAPLLAIHQRLKQTFDPRGVFASGRMYEGI
ncbi:MAG: glycolate oxidase subunit GlcE [Betaproteobacteria bacterium]|nr:glycolate oxidase subunit GlcE [Betaproteobacteria bacterium]